MNEVKEQVVYVEFYLAGHCIFAGEKNCGKSYLAYRNAGVIQQTYGAEAKIVLVVSEVIDKAFMKNAGLKIAYTDKEVEDYKKAYKDTFGKDLEPEKIAYLKEQVGEILINRTGNTEEALQFCVEVLKSNEAHILILDSLGGLESDEEDKKEELPDSFNIVFFSIVPKGADVE
jgi:RecA/RadA recombinase